MGEDAAPSECSFHVLHALARSATPQQLGGVPYGQLRMLRHGGLAALTLTLTLITDPNPNPHPDPNPNPNPNPNLNPNPNPNPNSNPNPVPNPNPDPNPQQPRGAVLAYACSKDNEE